MKAMKNNRQHIRHTICIRVKITHTSIDEIIVETKNISDGGLFVIVSPDKMPAIGTVVQGQVQGIVEKATIVEMKIVRVANHGVGLKYVGV
ncbi:MAG: hypothetical protein ACI80S_000121 [Pseudohongiellaceae bacterium]|jgi:hypothetical protein